MIMKSLKYGMETINVSEDETDITSNTLVESPNYELSITHASNPHEKSIINLRMNKSWAYRLLFLQYKAMQYQHDLAYLSTLGGAYHLCNHPETALMIARRQERLGHALGSTSLIMKSKGFQATNIAMMGEYKKAMKILNALIVEAHNKEMKDIVLFLQATKSWLYQHAKKRPNKYLSQLVENSSTNTTTPIKDVSNDFYSQII